MSYFRKLILPSIKPAFALSAIVLLSSNAQADTQAFATKDACYDYIIAEQLSDFGWSNKIQNPCNTDLYVWGTESYRYYDCLPKNEPSGTKYYPLPVMQVISTASVKSSTYDGPNYFHCNAVAYESKEAVFYYNGYGAGVKSVVTERTPIFVDYSNRTIMDINGAREYWSQTSVKTTTTTSSGAASSKTEILGRFVGVLDWK